MDADDRAAFSRDLTSTLAMVGQQYLYAMLDDFRLEHLKAASPDHPALAQHDALEALRTSTADATSPSALLLPLLPVRLLGDFAQDLQSPSLEFPRVDGHFWDRLATDGKRFVEARLPVRQHYESTLCEVRAWARWTSNGTTVRFVEEDGMPDVVATGEGLADLWCEVKAVSPAAAESTVEKAVTKANRQLRGCQEGGGIVVIWLVRDDAAALATTPSGRTGRCRLTGPTGSASSPADCTSAGTGPLRTPSWSGSRRHFARVLPDGP